MQNHEGILTRIRNAESAQEIVDLLKAGEDYTKASDRTRSRWKRKAEKRLKELRGK